VTSSGSISAVTSVVANVFQDILLAPLLGPLPAANVCVAGQGEGSGERNSYGATLCISVRTRLLPVALVMV